MRAIFVASLLLLTPIASYADDLRTVSVTISPILLALPVMELTGEIRLADDAGIAGIVGFGSATTEKDPAGDTTTFDVFEGGGQLNYYLLGDFDDGMHVGGEVMYVKVSGGEGDVSGVADGLGAGPYIGYKTTMDIGFTFVAQLGAQYVMAAAEAEEEGTGDKAKASDSGWTGLLNLNVGWSL